MARCSQCDRDYDAISDSRDMWQANAQGWRTMYFGVLGELDKLQREEKDKTYP